MSKFPVMLASPPKDIHRIKFPCIAQIKMDGMRAMIVKRDGEVTVYSRNGNKMIKLNRHFEAILEDMDNVVLDGELTVKDVQGNILDRKSGNGICHKAVESVGTISQEEVSRIKITIWDIIKVEKFDEGLDDTSGVARLEALAKLPRTSIHEIVDTYEISNIEEAEELFEEMLNKGEEGIILKNLEHPWEAKRSKQIVKMKAIKEIDLKIIGFAEGEGKASGMLGKFTCENKDGTIRTDCGTGFSDEQRKNLWEGRHGLIGKVCTIKYNDLITRRGSDTKALFLPVFVELRPDKDESD
jgi:DNA ligase-1